MKLVDANVLLYAVNEADARHAVSRAWLDAALAGHETVLLPWLCLLAFVRLTTHPSIFERPLPPGAALETVMSWLDRPSAIVPEPDRSHPARMLELLAATGAGGNLVNDAHIAALAVQYRAVVVTFDNDFGRFPGVRWEKPG